MLKNIFKKLLEKYGYKILNIENDEFYQFKKNDQLIVDMYKKYSMTSDLRRTALLKSFHYINNNKIQGDFVECGVWKGGNIMALKHLNNIYKTKKKIYAYDTFLGMSEPTEIDVKIKDGTIAKEKYANKKNEDNFSEWDKCTLENVVKNFTKNNLDMENIKLIKGKVEDTLLNNKNLPEKISLLRLDTDFYESTKIELEILYPLLSKGGVLIIDDYGSWKGAKKAVDEYFQKNITWMHFVDHDCRLIVKQ
jgi:O-methyltransferase